MQSVDDVFKKLDRSRFRSSFHLKAKDIEYINNKGMDVIRSHAMDFIKAKLVHYDRENDGRQTPMRGHPVFIAMHACGCCCRGCLYKWYRVAKEQDLSEAQQLKILNLLMKWIERDLKYNQKCD